MGAEALHTDDAVADPDVQAWEARGFNWEIQTDPPGQVRRDNISDRDALIKVLEGDMEIEFGGRTVRPKVGEELLIPAWVSHTIRNVGEGPSQWVRGSERELAQTD